MLLAGRARARFPPVRPRPSLESVSSISTHFDTHATFQGIIVTKGAVLRNPGRSIKVLAIVLGTAAVSACAQAGNVSNATSSTPWSRTFPAADSLRVEQVTRGVQHIFAWERSGPWAIHVLAIDAATCRPALDVVHAGPPLTAAAGVTAIAANATAGGAIAAMNADFFALPAGTPSGAQVSHGVVQASPNKRPVFAISEAGYWIDRARLAAAVWKGSDSGEDKAQIGQVNRPRAGDASHPANDGLALFTEWWGRPTTTDSAAITVSVRIVDGTASRGRGVVTLVSRAAGVALGRGRIALQGAADTSATATRASRWVARRVVGDTVQWDIAILPAAERFDRSDIPYAVTGAFPHLVSNGAPVTDFGEQVRADFGPARHPRSAIGWTAGGKTLLWVVVDGRQAPYSDGMSLDEMTALFRRLDAVEAVNLDGGGSTTMVIKGKIVNRVSDRNGERAVGNAITLNACKAASQ